MTAVSSTTALDRALDAGVGRLLGLQRPGGWWVGELESNATMIAEHLFMLHFLGLRDPVTDRKLGNELLHRMRADGTWSNWWEGPADYRQGPWAFHPAKLTETCAHILVYDVDGDGDNDLISSSAHKYGIWWTEQIREQDGSVRWERHEIDKSFSETHSLSLDDINGDKLTDVVTVKRYWTHGPGGDADPAKRAVMYWFELSRKDGKPVCTPHQFDDDSGVGTQFEVADVNGDGLLDVVTGNKKGANYFEQQRK